ncbi:MAG: amidohydrolase family protein [Pleomorphochaeta sp.]
MKKLIKAKYIMCLDSNDRIIENGYIIIKDGIITQIGELNDTSFENDKFDEVCDMKNSLVMPGLINSHAHTPMILTRGMCEGVSLFTMDGFINTLRRYEYYADAKLASMTVPLSCAEMIRTGTTTFVDQYFYSQNIFNEVDKSGMRAVIAYGIVELGDSIRRAQELKSCEEFIEKSASHNLITGWVGPHAFFVDNSLELIKAEIAMAKKYDSGFHIHFATSNEENDYCLEHFNTRAVNKMEELGILEIPIHAAHSITVNSDDMKILSKYPFHPIMAPSSAMRSGFPAAPVIEMRNAGLTVALGTDNVCSSNSYDMFGELGTAGKLIIHREQDASVITPKEIVHMATTEAAKALGRDDIGTLDIGKKADLIALDTRDIGFVPFCGQDLYTQLVYSVSGLSVTDSMVEGKWLMRNKELTTLDLEYCSNLAENATKELIRRML